MNAWNGNKGRGSSVRLGVWVTGLLLCQLCCGCVTFQTGGRKLAGDALRTRPDVQVLVAVYLPHSGRLAHADGGLSTAEAVAESVVQGLRRKGYAVGAPLRLLTVPVPKTGSLIQARPKSAGDAVPGAEAYEDGIRLDTCEAHALRRICDRLRHARRGKSAPLGFQPDLAAIGLSPSTVTVSIIVSGEEYTNAAVRESTVMALLTFGMAGIVLDRMTVEMRVLDNPTGKVLWMAARGCHYGGFPEDRLKDMVERLVDAVP